MRAHPNFVTPRPFHRDSSAIDRGARTRGNLGIGLAVLALIAGTTGTAYAAAVARNSVGTAQLKNGAVTSAKVRDGSLRAADFAVLPRGPVGPPGPAGTSQLTTTIISSGPEWTDEQSFSLPSAPPGTYRASYSISVTQKAQQPPGTQFYCSAREAGVPPYRAKSTGPFVPDAAFANSAWTFTGDPADWRIRCGLWVPQPDPNVTYFPAPVSVTSVFPSEITLEPVGVLDQQ